MTAVIGSVHAAAAARAVAWVDSMLTPRRESMPLMR